MTLHIDFTVRWLCRFTAWDEKMWGVVKNGGTHWTVGELMGERREQEEKGNPRSCQCPLWLGLRSRKLITTWEADANLVFHIPPPQPLPSSLHLQTWWRQSKWQSITSMCPSHCPAYWITPGPSIQGPLTWLHLSLRTPLCGHWSQPPSHASWNYSNSLCSTLFYLYILFPSKP